MRTHLHLFISRVGLICNVMFLYCMLVRHTKDFIGNQDINSIIITLGWAVSFFLNILLNLLWLFMFIRKRKVETPRWLLSINLAMLIFQLVYLLPIF